MRHVSSVFLALLVACGGSTGTQPPPPVPPGIARVVLLTDKGVVFTGKALPGQKLVAQVIDSAGAVIPSTDTSVVLTAQASPGWAVKGDTVIAPATEGFGTVRITATRADPSSAISDGAVVAATFNLTELHLQTYSGGFTGIMCRVDGPAYLADAGGNWNLYQGPKINGFPLDSVVLRDRVIVDSVNYSGSGDWRLNQYSFSGLVYWHAIDVLYYANDEQGGLVKEPGSPPSGLIGLIKQVPDSFALNANGTAIATARTGTVPSYTFDGAPFCLPMTGAYVHPGRSDSITLISNAP